MRVRAQLVLLDELGAHVILRQREKNELLDHPLMGLAEGDRLAPKAGHPMAREQIRVIDREKRVLEVSRNLGGDSHGFEVMPYLSEIDVQRACVLIVPIHIEK